MRINTNISGLISYNANFTANAALGKAIKGLSTGLRINSAADDAAGLAISTKMRAQIDGLGRAADNAQDGVSLIQVADGALNEVHSVLQRMRELAVQASNDTLTSDDRAYVQLEVAELLTEIDRISATTQFNKKKLLDGSASALWSSDRLSTAALVRGAIEREGNYEISLNASNSGQAEIQKSNIFNSRVETVERIGEGGGQPLNTTARVVFIIDDTGSISGQITKIREQINRFVQSIHAQGAENVEIGIASYAYLYGAPDGLSPRTFSGGSLWSNNLSEIDAALASIPANKPNGENVSKAIIDAVKTYFTSGTENNRTGDEYHQLRYLVAVTDDHDESNYGRPGAVDFAADARAALLGNGPETKVELSAIRKSNGNPANPTVLDPLIAETGGMAFEYGTDWSDELSIGLGTKIGEQANAAVPGSYIHETTIRQFYDRNGRFLLDSPQTLTLYQGERRTSVTLYRGETLSEIAQKLNDAIAFGLGNASYLSGFSGAFATHVKEGEDNTPESVQGTIVIRSAIPGAAGRIKFAGDEEMLKAFGFNVIQEARETEYIASVHDAHSGETIASSVRFSGNTMYGVVDRNVDISFDHMADLLAIWNEKTKSFDFITGAGDYKTYVHLADNAMILQIGANEGENMNISIGEISSRALGLAGLLVIDRESAARAVTQLDNAIGIVSTQRSKLGAYQNRLEHTIANLNATRTNTTASESRIRDTDMAKTMMDFTKLNILSQASTSMMGQSNQLPQNTLALLR